VSIGRRTRRHKAPRGCWARLDRAVAPSVTIGRGCAIVRARFRDEVRGSAAPWIYGIARNVLLMSIRRGTLERRATERLGLLEQLDRPQSVEDPIPEIGWATGADELLDALPADQREAVRLRVVEEMEYADVAHALGTSAGAARVRVHRGLTALRRHLATPREDARS
jgi:RNA polymerase sigma factor (sigma-70 family)